jgi:DNA polymerase I-like protein with 3'-5' exonuclease and polymerase domains
MKLYIDIETYSDIDIKLGVHKYVDTGNFDILLLAYAFDDGQVEVVDLVNDPLPSKVKDALTSGEVTIVAHNSEFERVCLNKYFDLNIHPFTMYDTAAASVLQGYPRSLEEVAKVLLKEEDQKLDTGKALINIYCKPHRDNSKASEDNWNKFKEYVKQDVETMRKLDKILKPMSAKEQLIKSINDMINARGIRVSEQLVDACIKARDANNANYRVVNRDGELINHNSAKQVLVEANKVFDMEDFRIDTVTQKYETLKANMNKTYEEQLIQDLLEARLHSSLASLKKLDAIKDRVVEGKIHDTFVYGGASTMRFSGCVTGDHEVLTPEGWVRLDQFNGGHVAAWEHVNGNISFQEAIPTREDYSGELIKFEDKRISFIGTPNHRFRVKTYPKGGHTLDRTAEDILASGRTNIPLYGTRRHRDTGECFETRAIVMIQADGSINEKGALSFHFSKQRKIERCKWILNKLGWVFSERNGVVHVQGKPLIPVLFGKAKTYGTWLFQINPEVFFDELQYWGAHVNRLNTDSFQYCTTNKVNADYIQALAHMSGRTCTMNTKTFSNDKWNTAYYLQIATLNMYHSLRKESMSKVPFKGEVYCVSVPSTYFVIRHNGKVYITGNSGVQLQNLPRGGNVDSAAAKLKEGSITNEELKSLVRPCFIADPGKVLAISDYSAIEARVAAWLAGEQWVLDAFKEGKDIYKETASRAFNIAYDDVTKEQRQQGKVQILACSFAGGALAMERMDFNHDINPNMYQRLVQLYRAANPNITKFWYALEDAFKKTLLDKQPYKVGEHISLVAKGNDVGVQLPSGRVLVYRQVSNKNGELSYTRWGTKGKAKVKLWMGVMFENLCQSVARDILCDALCNLEANLGDDGEVVGHVHDECIVLVKESKANKVHEIMNQQIDWAPGLPIKAETVVSPYYIK